MSELAHMFASSLVDLPTMGHSRLEEVLLRILPINQDFKFRMNFQSGSFENYYRQFDDYKLIIQRELCHRQYPNETLLVMPEGEALVQEGIDLFAERRLVPFPKPESLLVLSQLVAPDMVILQPFKGSFRIVAAAVCFPSKWDPKEKIGRLIEESHSVVPHLNSELGKNINARLQAMKTSETVFRYNLGLSLSSTLNQHPNRYSERSTSASPGWDQCTFQNTSFYLRLEWQALTKLPHGILFGIRPQSFMLETFLNDPKVKSQKQILEGLTRWLDTMPEEVAYYKGINPQGKANILSYLNRLDKQYD